MLANNGEDPSKPWGKEVVRCVMWSPPRSLSTTVERALIENRAIHVVHEPFGTPYYWSTEAGSSRQDSDTRCRDTYASVAQRLFQDAPPGGQRFIFSKNLSYYVSPHCIPKLAELLGHDYSRVHHSFMIRHPAKAISSLYYKSCVDNEKTGYTHFDPAEAGFTAMAALLEHLDAAPDCPPSVIIDADDLLEDPEGVMAAYCDALGLPFDESMLAWEPGPVPELTSPWSGWTDDVQASSGIRKRAKRSLPPVVSSLPKEVQDTIAEAMPIYEAMYARRLRVSPPGLTVAGADIEAPNGTELSSGGGGGASGWGKDAVERGEPCLTSPCCRPFVADPARVTGTILLLISVLIWVCQAELLQQIHSDGWRKPYLQAATLKSVWALTLPVWMLLSKINQSFQDEITFRRPLQPTLRVVLLSLGLTVLVQASSATWIASLDLTAVSINSAIYNINPLLVYAFSIPVLGETLSWTKAGAVLLAVLGTSIVTFGTAGSAAAFAVSDEVAVFGNVLVVLSATFFALKEVLFKLHFASVTVSLTPFTDALLVVGLIGAISAATLVPWAFVLDFTSIEPFVMPSPELMRGYGIVAVLMAAYQACLLASIALTSPTFVAMGTMLAVPASIAADHALKGYVVPMVALVGMGAIVSAFVLLMLADRVDEALTSVRASLRRSHDEPSHQPVKAAAVLI